MPGIITPYRLQQKTFFQTIMDTNPVGYWRLGEASGSVLNDSSGLGNHGAYTGTITYGTPGALAGDGNTGATITNLFGSSNIVVPGVAAFDLPTFSVIHFFKTTEAAGIVNYICTRWGTGTTGQIWGMDFQAAGTFRGYCRINAGTRTVSTPSAALNFHDNNWHMAAMTYSGTVLKVFADGVSIGTPVSITGTVQTDPTREIRIGHREGQPNGDQLSGGKDETILTNYINDAGIAALWARSLVA